MACGFWAADWNLYLRDKEVYFGLLDQVVEEAEADHVGLIPSLFWYYATVPDLVGPGDKYPPGARSLNNLSRTLKTFSIRPGKPLFIGEFGSANADKEKERRQFEELLEAIEQNGRAPVGVLGL
jgi:hypothetical protein